ncbi:hypothetical protein ACFU8W_34645 [Streptomyces sp. NPDC057565]|uniref:hypothetical protein n=1 Tax=Streptomyces sp. NPDC057565 TaxID=3346169 RepID=UPI0036A7329A
MAEPSSRVYRSPKPLATEHGGEWKPVHFEFDREELLRRPAVRNSGPESGVISPETVARIDEHSDSPEGEGEELPHCRAGSRRPCRSPEIAYWKTHQPGTDPHARRLLGAPA